MSSWSACGALLIALAAGHASRPVQDAAPAPAAAPEVVELAYAWPREGSVRVREMRKKRGQEASFAYTLRFGPDPAGDGSVIDFTDWEFLSINGRDNTQRGFKKVASELAPVLQVIPSLRISARGEFLECIGLDTLVERFLQSLRARGSEESEIQEFQAALADPRALAVIAEATAKGWRFWAGGLIGYRFELGTERCEEGEYPCNVPGMTLRGKTVYKSARRVVDGGADCLELVVRTDYEPESVRAMMLAIWDLFKEESSSEVRDQLKEATAFEELDGVWEISTLQPHRVESRSVMHLRYDEGRGMQEVEQLETRSFVFDWSALESPADLGKEQPEQEKPEDEDEEQE